jgi:Tol biopolymer transport system component
MRQIVWFLFVFLLVACAPVDSNTISLYLFRYEPAAILQFDPRSDSILRALPLEIPLECTLSNLHPQPGRPFLAVELACPGGPKVFVLDTDSGTLKAVVSEPVDSRFLAWGKDGLYLLIDSLGETRIVRADPRSADVQTLAIPPETYDLAPAPDGRTFTYSLSPGLGLGSELWVKRGGDEARLLVDPDHILAFTSWSPDGKQLAFIKVPDSDQPFTVGELWTMKSDGREQRFLAQTDAGHGYRAAWSPDGTRIAFVKRENPDDEVADRSLSSLESNLYIVEIRSGLSTPLTRMEKASVESPYWSPDGSHLAFVVALDGTMNVWMANIASGEIKPVLEEGSCCPAWVQK